MRIKIGHDNILLTYYIFNAHTQTHIYTDLATCYTREQFKHYMNVIIELSKKTKNRHRKTSKKRKHTYTPNLKLRECCRAFQ